MQQCQTVRPPNDNIAITLLNSTDRLSTCIMHSLSVLQTDYSPQLKHVHSIQYYTMLAYNNGVSCCVNITAGSLRFLKFLDFSVFGPTVKL